MSEEKIQYIFDIISNCGEEKIEVVSPEGDIKQIVKYCDNKVCNNPGCMVHREHHYKRNHQEQINFLDSGMHSPKAWVFTGWALPYPIDRGFCRQKFLDLKHILNSRVGAVTPFSIHMEVKLRDSTWYLHFHVVMGGVKDFHFVRHLWGRIVKYQMAIKKDQLTAYVSKYASKTPIFKNDVQRIDYLRYIYKTKTSHFSVGKSGYIKSGWYLYDGLEWEAYCCEKRYYVEGHEDDWFIRSYENRKYKLGKLVSNSLESFDIQRFFPEDTFENFMQKVKKYSKTGY